MKYIRPLIFIFSCLLISHQVCAKVYKWTDDKGLTHFSEHPPLNQSNEVIKPKTGHSDPVNYSTPATTNSDAPAAAANNTTQNKTEHVSDPDRCASARKNQNILKTSARVKVQDDKGETRYLTPAEIQEKVAETDKAIQESCD